MDYEVWLRTKKLERMSFNTNSVTPRYMRISEKYLPSKPPRSLSTEPLIIKYKILICFIFLYLDQ